MASKYKSQGFTLVEILVVIVIIGILAGALIPAVTSVRRSVRTAFLRNECAAFETAIEAYKLKYGDYPPDFSNVEIVDRHYRRIFPEILDSELLLLFRLCDNERDTSPEQIDNNSGYYVPALMDRGEALIWAVGGFSSDPQRPFTGQGGPLQLIPNLPNPNPVNPSHYQYNASRDNALMDLEVSSLTLKTPDAGAALSPSNRAESDDESEIKGDIFSVLQKTNDLFPAYRYDTGHAPYVYFDSRTYLAAGSNMMIDTGGDSGNVQLNGFATHNGETYNTVRPILSDKVNTDSLTGFSGLARALRLWAFNNPKTFQVLSPGLDGIYGSIADQDGGDPISAAPFYWQYPTGRIVVPTASTTPDTTPASLINNDVNAYNISSLSLPGIKVRESFEKDNIASFTSRSFEDDLP